MVSNRREPEVSVWFSEAIERIRVDATPGGISLDVEDAREWRDGLDAAIEQAEQYGEDGGPP